MLRSVLAALFALVGSHSACALSIRFDFPSAAKASAVIAWVEIERVESITAPSGERCGARYLARVIDGIKGVPAGARIEFGHFTGRTVGSQHFVFLDDATKMSAGARATVDRSVIIPGIADACATQVPRYGETAEGVGTIPVMPGDHVSNAPAVSFGDPLYAIPANLPGFFWHSGHVADGQFFGSVQISADDFRDYLKRLVVSP